MPCRPRLGLCRQQCCGGSQRIMEHAPLGRVQPVGASFLQGIAPAPAATASRSAWYGRVPVGKLRPGDVLVCRFTSPVWSVLVPTSGTLVTDTRRNPVARPPASLASIERPPGSPLATPRPISRRSGPHLGTAGRGRNDAVRRRLLAASPHGRVSNVQHVIGSRPLAGGTPVGASRVRASDTTKPSGSIANWSSCLC